MIPTSTMMWTALDNMAMQRKISCARLALTSGLSHGAFNKNKRIKRNGGEHWPSMRTLALVLNATNTSWIEFAGYFPQSQNVHTM